MNYLLKNHSNPWNLIKTSNNINVYASSMDTNVERIDTQLQYKLVQMQEKVESQHSTIGALIRAVDRNNQFLWDFLSKLLILIVAYHNSDYFRGFLSNQTLQAMLFGNKYHNFDEKQWLQVPWEENYETLDQAVDNIEQTINPNDYFRYPDN